MHKKEAHTLVPIFWRADRNWAGQTVRINKGGRVCSPLVQHVLGLVLSTSFLIRGTGQLSHSVWRERRGEKTHFLITNQYLHVPHLHTLRVVARKVISKDFVRHFTLNGRDSEAHKRLSGWEHTAALTAGAAWRHAWVPSHVWVWTWTEWMRYTVCTCVCWGLPLVLKCCRTDRASADDVVTALTFCCSFIPATTGTLRTVESLASG